MCHWQRQESQRERSLVSQAGRVEPKTRHLALVSSAAKDRTRGVYAYILDQRARTIKVNELSAVESELFERSEARSQK